jgi:uncharacterized protein (TIRG00374 family)
VVVIKRILWNASKYLLPVGVLTYVIWKNWAPVDGRGLGYVWQRHVTEGQPVPGRYLLMALPFFTAAVCMTLLRWYVLVRAQDLPFRVRDAFRLGFIGIFFNTCLPGSVGGDIIKAAALARGQSRRTVAVATVIMDRLIALWALVWFVALLGAAFWLGGGLEGAASIQGKFITGAAGAVVVVSALAWLLLGLLPDHRAERFAGRLGRLPRVGAAAAEFWRAVWMYRCRQASVALAMGMSFVGFIGFVLSFYYGALTLMDGDLRRVPTVTQHFLLVPVGMVIKAMPLFPGGVGIGELGFGGLYAWFKADPTGGILGSLIYNVFGWLLGFLGFLVYLLMRSHLGVAPTPPAAPVAPAGADGGRWGEAPLEAVPHADAAAEGASG